MDTELVGLEIEIRGCEDARLLSELQELVRRDRRGEVRVLMYLGEVDERRLFLGQGYSSLFRYATRVLRMSEHQAYLRIQVARLARKFPVILGMIAEGEVNLSTLKVLDTHLTVDSHRALLERARNKTKAEVELLVAELAPKPDVPDRVRKVPERGSKKAADRSVPADTENLFTFTNTTAPQAVGAAASGSYVEPTKHATVHAEPPPAAPAAVAGARTLTDATADAHITPAATANAHALTANAHVAPAATTAAHAGTAAHAVVTAGAHVVPAATVARAAAAPVDGQRRASVGFDLGASRWSCKPLGRGRFELRMTASQSLRDKLSQLQHLLRHRVPRGELAVITELAFDLLIERTLKQRFAQVAKPRSSASKLGAVASSPSGGHGAAKSAGPLPPAAEQAKAEANLAGPSVQPLGRVDEVSGASEAGAGVRSRRIPSAVLREVFARDGARCTFESASGHRCDERGMLEVHHVRAFALGGDSTVENLRLVCKAHNGFFAVQDFGSEFMQRKRASSKTSSDQSILFGH